MSAMSGSGLLPGMGGRLMGHAALDQGKVAALDLGEYHADGFLGVLPGLA